MSTAIENLQAAQQTAYALAAQISWPGEFHRTDIGWRAIARD